MTKKMDTVLDGPIIGMVTSIPVIRVFLFLLAGFALRELGNMSNVLKIRS